VHAAQQPAEFAADVKRLLTDSGAVLQLRCIHTHVLRPTQARDGQRRYGRSTEPFQLADDRAQAAGVPAHYHVLDKTQQTSRLLRNRRTVCQQRLVRFYKVQQMVELDQLIDKRLSQRNRFQLCNAGYISLVFYGYRLWYIMLLSV